MRWLVSIDPTDELKIFREQYAQARESLADVYFDEVITLADGAAEAADAMAEADSERTAVARRADVYRRSYNEEIQARRLRIDSRKWVAARMAPWKYSETRINENKGDGPVVNVTVDTGIAASPGSQTDGKVKDQEAPEYVQ